jgi:hypothetical protein
MIPVFSWRFKLTEHSNPEAVRAVEHHLGLATGAPVAWHEGPAAAYSADPAVATMISADQPTVVVMKSCQELCADEFSGDH